MAAAAASVTNNDQSESNQHQHTLTEAQLYLTSDNEDDTAETEDQSPETSVPNRPTSEFSMITSSAASKQAPPRSYQLAQLERALLSAKLLKTNDTRIQFENDYILAIREHTFDKFARDYYKKVHDYHENIKKKEELKRTRLFTLASFEQNFLTLYPARDIKIKFSDESNPSIVTKIPNTRSSSAHPKSASLASCDPKAVELFYAAKSPFLMEHPERAEKIMESYAKKAAHSLKELLPRVSKFPYRVKIMDERDTTKPNEHILLERNHRHAISSIVKRRHLVIKMMAQTQKNQTKTEQQWKRRRIGVDNPTCYREILERTNEFEGMHRERSSERPQTAIVPRAISRKNMSLSASVDIPRMRATTAPSIPLLITPFHDSLSLLQVENTRDVRVVNPTRPLTAPIKTKWANYC